MQILPISQPAITIYADESCLNNQAVGTRRRGGCAGVVDVDGLRFGYAYAEPDTTNNRMAILSAILPLEWIPKQVPVRFVSDSQHLVKGATEWLRGWIKAGWRGSSGPVKNRDLWERLARLLDGRAIEFVWVKGHNGHPENEQANAAAIDAATRQDGYNDLLRPLVQSEIIRLAVAADPQFDSDGWRGAFTTERRLAGSVTPQPPASAPPRQQADIDRCRTQMLQIREIQAGDFAASQMRAGLVLGFFLGLGYPQAEARHLTKEALAG